MQLLQQLYSVYSPSGHERKMKRFVRRMLAPIQGVRVSSDSFGNLYIEKGESDTYPCVVAHLDQVQDVHSKDFRAIVAEDIIIGFSATNKQQEGLGADDKNGIWVALKCLQKYDAIKCAFFVQEEVGCIGSSNADMSFFDNCRFVVQCDRRNGDDLITNIYEEMCSEAFLNDCNYQSFGYHVQHGAMTDVAELRARGLRCSAVNMSCGYYNPHTDYEFTNIAELYNCLRFVQYIIEHCTDVYNFDAPKRERATYSVGSMQSWNDWVDYYDTKQATTTYEYDIQMSDLFDIMMDDKEKGITYTIDAYYQVLNEYFPELSYEDFGSTYSSVYQEW